MKQANKSCVIKVEVSPILKKCDRRTDDARDPARPRGKTRFDEMRGHLQKKRNLPPDHSRRRAASGKENEERNQFRHAKYGLKLKTREAADLDVLAERTDRPFDHVADAPGGIANVFLLKKRVAILRSRRRDLHRELMREAPEFRIAGHKVRFTLQFKKSSHPGV